MTQSAIRNPKSAIRAVIFDLDGVLIDSAVDHFASWQAIALELGQSITKEQFDATFGLRNPDIIPRLFGIHDADRVETLGERKEAMYRERIRVRVPACPYAVELVRALRAAGLPLAVGSSGHPENIRLALEGMGIADCFQAVVTGADVTRGKPDPQVFLLAAAHLKVEPKFCAVFEDAPAGIAAALAAGMYAIGVAGSHSRESLREAHWVVESLAEPVRLATRDWPIGEGGWEARS